MRRLLVSVLVLMCVAGCSSKTIEFRNSDGHWTKLQHDGVFAPSANDLARQSAVRAHSMTMKACAERVLAGDTVLPEMCNFVVDNTAGYYPSDSPNALSGVGGGSAVRRNLQMTPEQYRRQKGW